MRLTPSLLCWIAVVRCGPQQGSPLCGVWSAIVAAPAVDRPPCLAPVMWEALDLGSLPTPWWETP